MSRAMSCNDAARLAVFHALKTIKTEEELLELKLALSNFFNNQAQKELDRLWESGKLNQATLDELRGAHLRTPYVQ